MVVKSKQYSPGLGEIFSRSEGCKYEATRLGNFRISASSCNFVDSGSFKRVESLILFWFGIVLMRVERLITDYIWSVAPVCILEFLLATHSSQNVYQRK